MNIRSPWWSLIWPSIFLPGVAVFIGRSVLIRGWSRDSTNRTGSALGAGIVIGGLFVVFALCSWVAIVRAGVRSDGTSLRIRAGLTTRIVPAEDISGFVAVNRVGMPTDRWPSRPAIVLRRGSAAARQDEWSDRPAWARAFRRVGMLMSNRKPGALPVPGTQHRVLFARTTDRYLAELGAWHSWAVARVGADSEVDRARH